MKGGGGDCYLIVWDDVEKFTASIVTSTRVLRWLQVTTRPALLTMTKKKRPRQRKQVSGAMACQRFDRSHYINILFDEKYLCLLR